jgi:hypothetical protein
MMYPCTSTVLSMPTLAANGDQLYRHRMNSPTGTPRPAASMMLCMRLLPQSRGGSKVSAALFAEESQCAWLHVFRPRGIVVGGNRSRYRN